MEVDTIVQTYIQSYRDLVAAEQVGESVVLSLPLHLAASHRIEITVTRHGTNSYILSDSARTLGEVLAAGYSLNAQMQERLAKIAGAAGFRIIDMHLVLETTPTELGNSIQRFLEISKTIGDVYLVHKQRERPDRELLREARSVVESMGLPYRMDQKIKGEIEMHQFDLVVPPNGHRGMVLSVLGGQNTHTAAQIWGFKCDDVRRGEWYQRTQVRLALIYDVRSQVWSDTSRKILNNRADLAMASHEIDKLRSLTWL